jgi:cation diffusion facilitator family transporter
MTTKSSEDSGLHQMTQVTLVGAAFDLVLGAAKISLGLIDNSQALVADGIHSISDLVTDAIVIFAIRESRKVADEEHPYGHARIETIATAILALSLFIVALGIANHALTSLQEPVGAVTPGWIALAVVVASALCKEGIYHYTMRAAKLHQSAILEANAWHSRTDAISSLIVLVGISGAMLGLPALDAVAAIGVAGIIAKVAWDLGAPSIKELVDTGVDESYLSQLQNAVRTTHGVRSFHALRTRRMGADVLVDVHVKVDPMITVSEGHQISEQVRYTLVDSFEEIHDVTVHIDAEPETDEDEGFTPSTPSREELIEALRISWQDYEPASMVQRTNLHYLNGAITIEVYLPLELASSPAAANLVADKIKDLALNASPAIEDVQVLFAR